MTDDRSPGPVADELLELSLIWHHLVPRFSCKVTPCLLLSQVPVALEPLRQELLGSGEAAAAAPVPVGSAANGRPAKKRRGGKVNQMKEAMSLLLGCAGPHIAGTINAQLIIRERTMGCPSQVISLG